MSRRFSLHQAPQRSEPCACVAASLVLILQTTTILEICPANLPCAWFLRLAFTLMDARRRPLRRRCFCGCQPGTALRRAGALLDRILLPALLAHGDTHSVSGAVNILSAHVTRSLRRCAQPQAGNTVRFLPSADGGALCRWRGRRAGGEASSGQRAGDMSKPRRANARPAAQSATAWHRQHNAGSWSPTDREALSGWRGRRAAGAGLAAEERVRRETATMAKSWRTIGSSEALVW